MEKKQGEISLLEIKDGVSPRTKNPYRRAVFTINGTKYSTFDSKIMEGFVPGDFVEMEGAQEGQYWNMKTMKKVDESGTVDAPTEQIAEVVKPGFEQANNVEEPPKEKVLDADEIRVASMCISYAKDLVVADKIKTTEIRKWSYDFLNLYRAMTGKGK